MILRVEGRSKGVRRIPFQQQERFTQGFPRRHHRRHYCCHCHQSPQRSLSVGHTFNCLLVVSTHPALAPKLGSSGSQSALSWSSTSTEHCSVRARSRVFKSTRLSRLSIVCSHKILIIVSSKFQQNSQSVGISRSVRPTRIASLAPSCRPATMRRVQQALFTVHNKLARASKHANKRRPPLAGPPPQCGLSAQPASQPAIASLKINNRPTAPATTSSYFE
jgi:hypothetical protein